MQVRFLPGTPLVKLYKLKDYRAFLLFWNLAWKSLKAWERSPERKKTAPLYRYYFCYIGWKHDEKGIYCRELSPRKRLTRVGHAVKKQFCAERQACRYPKVSRSIAYRNKQARNEKKVRKANWWSKSVRKKSHEEWKEEYKEERPHSACAGLPPALYARQIHHKLLPILRILSFEPTPFGGIN